MKIKSSLNSHLHSTQLTTGLHVMEQIYVHLK